MAKTNLSKKWDELSENEKRTTLWRVMDNKSLGFKTKIDQEFVVDLIKKTKDLDFIENADALRKEIYELCLSIADTPQKIRTVKAALKIKE